MTACILSAFCNNRTYLLSQVMLFSITLDTITCSCSIKDGNECLSVDTFAAQDQHDPVVLLFSVLCFSRVKLDIINFVYGSS